MAIWELVQGVGFSGGVGIGIGDGAEEEGRGKGRVGTSRRGVMVSTSQ